MNKGERLNGLFKIIKRGSACVGQMGFETPYIDFKSLSDGQEYQWTSEDIDYAGHKVDLSEGHVVTLQAFAYYDALRRVRIHDGNRVFRGMAWHRKNK